MLRTRREAGLDFSFCHGRNKAPYCSGKSHFPTACGGHRWGAYLHCLAFCLDTSRNRSWEIRGFYFIPIPKKDNAKESSNYCTIALISHASKVMLKILQARLQQYVNYELSDVQAGFRKGRGTRDQIANIRWIMEKAREFQKNIYFCFIDYPKSFVWITTNCGKF